MSIHMTRLEEFRRDYETFAEEIKEDPCRSIKSLDSFSLATIAECLCYMVDYLKEEQKKENKENKENEEVKEKGTYKVPKIVYFTSYGRAKEVIEKLNTYIGMYGHATIADYYNLTNQPVNGADFRFGWEKKIGDAATIHVPSASGYIINFPDPVPINY